MNSLKIVALVATVALAACGSREWRSNQGNKAEDVSTKGDKSHQFYNSQDQESSELLKQIGGASLTIGEPVEGGSDTRSNEGYAKVQVVMKGSCEQFVQSVMPLETGVSNGVEAEVLRTTVENDQEGHGWFESHCIGKDGSCDQVAVLFRHNHDGKRAETVITFSKNGYGNYSVNPVQKNGVAMVEADVYLKTNGSQCPEPKKGQEESPEFKKWLGEK